MYDEFFYFKTNGKYNEKYLETYDISNINILLNKISCLPDDIPKIKFILKKTKELIKEYTTSYREPLWNECINDSKVEFCKLRSSGKRKYVVTCNNTESKRTIWMRNSKFIINNMMRICLQRSLSDFKKNFSLKINKNEYYPDVMKQTIEAIRGTNLHIHSFLFALESMNQQFTVNELWQEFLDEDGAIGNQTIQFGYFLTEMEHNGLVIRKNSSAKKKFEESIERLYWEPEFG